MTGDRLLEAYPLTWPLDRPRTRMREFGHFKVPFAVARDELLRELERLGARRVIVSSNVPLRRDGLPYADAAEPRDPGVAVYFERVVEGVTRPFVIACDTYQRVKHNLRAIGLTVEALRTIQRHGASSMLEQAFTGFAALPPATVTEPPWRSVLGSCSSPAEARAARDRLALERHPDVGGSDEQMAIVNRAYDRAIEELDR